MATVRLGRYELEEYDLPRVCMRCGARASHYKSKKFQWFPPWAWLVLGWLGAMMFMKTVTMPVPLCEKHKWHWVWPPLVAGVGVAVLLLWAFAGAAIASHNEKFAPFVFLPLAVVFLGWLVALIVMSIGTIRPTEITDKSVTLRGVSPEFIEALEEVRRGDDDDRPRRGRSRRDDDEDEDDRPRRKRARNDDEDERPRAKRRPAKAEDDGGYYDPERRRRRDENVEGEDDR